MFCMPTIRLVSPDDFGFSYGKGKKRHGPGILIHSQSVSQSADTWIGMGNKFMKTWKNAYICFDIFMEAQFYLFDSRQSSKSSNATENRLFFPKSN